MSRGYVIRLDQELGEWKAEVFSADPSYRPSPLLQSLGEARSPNATVVLNFSWDLIRETIREAV